MSKQLKNVGRQVSLAVDQSLGELLSGDTSNAAPIYIKIHNPINGSMESEESNGGDTRSDGAGDRSAQSQNSDRMIDDGYLMHGMDIKAQRVMQRFLSTQTDDGADFNEGAENDDDDDDDGMEFTDAELSDLVYAFMACDLKSSGMVDAEELQAVLCVFGARREIDSASMLFTKIDIDGDGKLDKEEVLAALEELSGNVLLPKTFENMFEQMDANSDGVITKEEFEMWWDGLENVDGLFGYGMISKSAAIGWARQLRIEQVVDIIIDSKRQYRSDDDSAVAIRTSARLARAIAASNKERTSGKQIGFQFDGKQKSSRAPIDHRQQLKSAQAQYARARQREMERRTTVDTAQPGSPNTTLLSFQEYVYMMRSGMINEFIPGKNWRAGAHNMRNLRTAFDTADVDGSGEIDLEEFEAVISALHHTGAGDFDIEYIWKVMNPQRLPEITFAEFVVGISAVQADDNLGNLDLAAPNPWELLSLVIDTPVSKAEEHQLLNAYGPVVKFGLLTLKRIRKPLDKAVVQLKLTEVKEGKLHVMDEHKQGRLRVVRRRLIRRAALIGAVSGMCTASWEIFLIFLFASNGVINPDSGEASARNVMLMWWFFNLVMVAAVASIEITTLYFQAIKHAVKVARAIHIRLWPLNRDRAFVASALVRAALELGNSSGTIYGVDPKRENSGNSWLAVGMHFVLYRLKIVLTGLSMKTLVRLTVPQPAASFIAPWMVVPATSLWNAMVAKSIMTKATTTAMGISTSIELFNELISAHKLEQAEMSEELRLQLCRGIAVAIVRHGDMHPTKELLLRHCIQFLGLQRQLAVASKAKVDDAEVFLREMVELEDSQQRLVLQVHLLTLVLDGSISRREQNLWRDSCACASPNVARYSQSRLLHTTALFRSPKSSLQCDMLLGAFDPAEEPFDPDVPAEYRFKATMPCW